MTNPIPNKVVENVFLGFFILLPFVFSASILDPFLIPRSIFTICFLAFVVLFLIFKKRIHFYYINRFPIKLFGLFFISSLLSFSQSELISESHFTVSRQLIIAVFFVLSFVLLSENIIRPEKIIKAVIYFGIIAITIALLAILNKTINGQHLLAQVDTLSGTFANKNLLSSILFLGIPFYFIGLRYGGKTKTISTIAIVFTVFILFVIRTRTVLLALILFFVFVLFRSIKDKLGSHSAFKKTTAGLYSTLFAAVLIFYFVNGVQNLGFKKSIFNTYFDRMLSSDTLNTRILFWKNSILMFKENFLLGVGSGNWQLFFPKYGLNNFTRPEMVNGLVSVQNPHNDFLWILCETGLLGFISYFGFIFFTLYQAFWLSKNSNNPTEKRNFFYLFSGIIGYLFISFFDFPSSRIEHQLVFMVILATVNHSFYKQKNSAKNLKFRVYLPFFLLFCLGYSLFVSVKRYQSEKQIFQLKTQSSKNNSNEILLKTTQAKNQFYEIDSNLFPMEWHQGLAYFQKNDYPKSLELFQKAYEINPYHIHVINNYAGALELNNHRKKAILFYQKALDISNNFEDARLNLAACYYKESDFENAFLTIDKCDVNSSNLNYKTILVPILKKKKDLIIKSLKAEKLNPLVVKKWDNNDFLIQQYIQSKHKKITFENFIKNGLYQK